MQQTSEHGDSASELASQTPPAPVASRDEATARAERIRAGVRSYIETLADIEAAYRARDWTALGYESWDAYTSGEFSEARLQLSADNRQEAVRRLRSSGMSVRAIGSALGISKSTVADVAGVHSRTGAHSDGPAPAVADPFRRAPAAPVTGLDGKTYQPAQPKPDDEPIDAEIVDSESTTVPPPRNESRAPLTNGLLRIAIDLDRLVNRIERVHADDRFTRNAQQVSTQLKPGELRRAIQILQAVLDDLPNDTRTQENHA